MEEIKYPTGNFEIDWLLEKPNRALETNSLSEAIKYLIEKHNELVRAMADTTNENKGLHKHFVSNNEAGFILNALYEKEVADKPKHYIPPISEVLFCPNCESDNTHENLRKHHYRCYDCGFAWAK